MRNNKQNHYKNDNLDHTYMHKIEQQYASTVICTSWQRI